jgi:hypothetical protein
MKILKTFERRTESWRAWLAKNHASEREVWVIFPKKHTGEKCMSYEDSVEEALCHGWIDSIIKRIDDQTYARKFTPRTDNLNWSDVNKRRVAKCIREGRMTEIGLAKIAYENVEHPSPKPRPGAAAVHGQSPESDSGGVAELQCLSAITPKELHALDYFGKAGRNPAKAFTGSHSAAGEK